MLHYTRLERLAKDKNYSLLGTLVSYEENECCQYGPRLHGHIHDSSFSLQLKNGPNNLACYIILGWKCLPRTKKPTLMRMIISYKENEVFSIWWQALRTTFTTVHFLCNL
jgi:hypothetical protein